MCRDVSILYSADRSAVEIVIDLCRIIAVDGARCIEQYSQHVLFNVSHMGCIVFQTFKHIVNVHAVEAQQLFLYQVGRVFLAAYGDCWTGGAKRLCDEIHDFLQPSPVIVFALGQLVVRDVLAHLPAAFIRRQLWMRF